MDTQTLEIRTTCSCGHNIARHALVAGCADCTECLRYDAEPGPEISAQVATLLEEGRKAMRASDRRRRRRQQAARVSRKKNRRR